MCLWYLQAQAARAGSQLQLAELGNGSRSQAIGHTRHGQQFPMYVEQSQPTTHRPPQLAAAPKAPFPLTT